MNCSRCGAAEAVLKRDAAFYCGKCALARDWEEVIALVQEELVAVAAEAAPTIDFGAPSTPSAPAATSQAASAPAPPPAPASPPPPAAAPAPVASIPAPVGAAAAPAPAPGPADLPADPFA